MITGDIKSQIDQIWNAFWSGGISNPMEVMEQMTYLLFIRRLDENQVAKENKANRTGKPIEAPIFRPDQQALRWSQFSTLGDARAMYDTVADQVFPFIKTLGSSEGSTYSKHMKDARFTIPTPALLSRVVDVVAKVPMEDKDTKGDIYEYMLAKIASAGQNGQFRTPRHIIQMMVALMQPKPEDTICDPACGTAGFLVAASEYLLAKHRNEVYANSADGARRFNNDTFFGYDFDSTMLRIGSMNMLLHGVENPHIENRDSLSEAHSTIANQFSLILANPPFAGSVDGNGIAKNLQSVITTKKTELLFVALFLRLLKLGGRAAVIVPDGVLFGSSKAHKDLRRTLVEKQRLEAIISMPSGVFRPYAGVSTAIMIFTRTDNGGTDQVWFYDMQADGFSLDDKRTPLDASKHDNNNIPDIIRRFHDRAGEKDRKPSEQSFFVDKQLIAKVDDSVARASDAQIQTAQGAIDRLNQQLAEASLNEGDRRAVNDSIKDQQSIITNATKAREDSRVYDLSINRYKEVVREVVEHASPRVILAELEALENEIVQGMAQLKEMLG